MLQENLDLQQAKKEVAALRNELSSLRKEMSKSTKEVSILIKKNGLEETVAERTAEKLSPFLRSGIQQLLEDKTSEMECLPEAFTDWMNSWLQIALLNWTVLCKKKLMKSDNADILDLQGHHRLQDSWSPPPRQRMSDAMPDI